MSIRHDRQSIFGLICGISAIFLPGIALWAVPVYAQNAVVSATTIAPAPNPAPPPARSHSPNESGQFQQALELVDSGEFTAAFNLAQGFKDIVERRVVQWSSIYYSKGAIDHRLVMQFQTDAPDFATRNLFKTRVEQALTKTTPDTGSVIALLGGEMPNILDAQILLARAYMAKGQSKRAGEIIKSIWIRNFLDTPYETRIIGEFGNLLSTDDHWQRAVHLLMHDRARGTERIMDKLSPAQKSLARARIAVSRKQSDAPALLARVDSAYRDHPLFHFARGQAARRKGQLAEAIGFLDQAGGDAPDAAEFWYERRLISRRALAAGDIKTAYAAAAGYKDGPEGRVVDAHFHAGWIALEFLNDPAKARNHFEQMRALSTLPNTITQSHYWLGKSLQVLGRDSDAQKIFGEIARFHMLYYGQLARLELGIIEPGLRETPSSAASETIFEQRELVQATRLLAANGRKDMAERLLRQLMQQLRDPGELVLAARLAQSIDAHHVAILIADVADKRGVALDLFNFPRDGLPSGAQLAEIDKAAVYAVARQESRFNARAVSRSGARGLMQLMPATAKETARKKGIPYSASRLISDPAYNARLGSSYLAAQLNRYDGSLILAAAAYNAGGGNANKWIRTFGDPRSSEIDPVNWIESIPFVETRKYVQSVLANYTIYRARLGDDRLTIRQALRRIPH